MAKKISEVTARYIFETMDYGTVNENLDLAEAWFKKTDIKLKSTPEDIEKVIQTHEQQIKVWHNTAVLTKSKLLNKLASAIDTYSTLLCQIELKSRNILTKDTKNKSIQIFVDYLKYYAGWANICEKYFPNCKPYGVCACYLSADTPLSIFGGILAAALSSGNTIIFGVSSKFIPVACFISELCKNTGFPEGTISFVETNDPKIFLTHERIKKITYIGNLYDKKFSEINININKEKNLTSLHLGKSNSIVFDSADLDSACDSIIYNSWGYGGMFPCGINQVFVQENIYNDFVNRMKSKIEKLNVSHNNKIADKTCDIKINKPVLKANDMIDIVNKLPLQLGHKHFGNDVIFEDKSDDVLSILAFRTANEAVQLVNNSKYGLGCSVWTENISLANEVSNKLKAGIIWINAHGKINANASFSPFKGSGNGHFGGKDGLLEFLTTKNPVQYKRTPFKLTNFESDLPNTANKQTLIYYSGGFKKSESGLIEQTNKKDVRNCVESAKKSYETWNKVEPKIRAQSLTKLAELSASIKMKNSQILDKWIEYLYEWSTYTNNTESFYQSNPNLQVLKEALGVIVIELYTDANYSCLQLIAAALAYGNAVIIVNCSDDLQEFLENVCKINSSSGIPAGIFNAFFNPNTDIINTLLNHREIQTYFTSFLVKDSQFNFTHISRLQNIDDVDYCSYKNVLNVVTKDKFIWTSVGESFL